MSDYDPPINRAPRGPIISERLIESQASASRVPLTEGAQYSAKLEGVKHDQGKPRFALIPPRALEEEAKVWTFGAVKYGDWNWTKGLKTLRVVSAVLRHIFAYLAGQDLDPESGLGHLSHARCSLGMLEEMRLQGKHDHDDRIKVVSAVPAHPTLPLKS